MKLEHLTKRCKQNDRLAQKEIFMRYKNRFYTLCMRYLSDNQLAEDVLMQGFMQIFAKLPEYEKTGSFEGWMHRIMVNFCLMEIRKKKNLHLTIDDLSTTNIEAPDALDTLYESELLSLIKRLPSGCRTVFNMYVIEGFKHKEIAAELGISLGTSKSQLHLAKKKLREMISGRETKIQTL